MLCGMNKVGDIFKTQPILNVSSTVPTCVPCCYKNNLMQFTTTNLIKWGNKVLSLKIFCSLYNIVRSLTFKVHRCKREFVNYSHEDFSSPSSLLQLKYVNIQSGLIKWILRSVFKRERQHIPGCWVNNQSHVWRIQSAFPAVII